MELIKHFFGICGESHINIFSLLVLVLLFNSICYIYKYYEYTRPNKKRT